MKDPDTDHRHEIALFRYGLIADLVHLSPGAKGLYRRLEDKAAKDCAIPGSTRTRIPQRPCATGSSAIARAALRPSCPSPMPTAVSPAPAPRSLRRGTCRPRPCIGT
jgi:putative transposase